MSPLPSSRMLLPFCLVVCLATPVGLMADEGQQTAPPPAPERTTPQASSLPDLSGSPEQLEERGDLLRAEKRYLDAIDFYKAAIAKQPTALLWNKEGMAYLLMQRPVEATKCFDHAIKTDKHAAEGYNNRGYMEFTKKNYNKAIRYYQKALSIHPTDAVFHYNMASAYFAMHNYKIAAQEYRAAYLLDPDIFQRVSRIGVMAQSTSPEDRAAFSFMVARMYAQAGDVDHSLEYLRKAMEEGYKDVKKVYTEPEFATLREDKRFAELMAQKPQPIQ
jgi:tetratricopeptide (TPR) repeat protein